MEQPPKQTWKERAKSFLGTFYTSRWLSLYASLLLASISDVSLSFSVFSAAAVDDKGYTEDDMRYAASVGAFGRYLGAFATGILGTFLGPKLSVLTGITLVTTSLGSLSSYAERNSKASVDAIASAYLFGMIGFAFFATTLVTVSMKNFPSTSHGAIAGLTKAFLNLSPTFLNVLYAMFHTDNNREPDADSAGNFLQTVVVLVLLFGLATFVLINIIPTSTVPYTFETSQKLPITLFPWYVHFGVLVLMLFILDTCAAYGADPGTGAGVALLVSMLLLLSLIPMYHGPVLRKREGGQLDLDALLFSRATELNTLGRLVLRLARDICICICICICGCGCGCGYGCVCGCGC